MVKRILLIFMAATAVTAAIQIPHWGRPSQTDPVESGTESTWSAPADTQQSQAGSMADAPASSALSQEGDVEPADTQRQDTVGTGQETQEEPSSHSGNRPAASSSSQTSSAFVSRPPSSSSSTVTSSASSSAASSAPTVSSPVVSFPTVTQPPTSRPAASSPSSSSAPSQPNAGSSQAQSSQPASSGSGVSQPNNDGLSSFAQQVVDLVNEERAKAGLQPLAVHTGATAAAQVRAVETEQSFSHTRPDGSSFTTALTEQGVSYRSAGENIAWGQRTPQQVMEGWMNSSGHRANILSERFTAIGVGYYRSAAGVNYWTQLFIG